MAQNITLMGANYEDVPSVTLPRTGGGTASFVDIGDTTASASDVLEGKVMYTASGIRTIGTGAIGGGVPSGGITNEVLTKVSSTDYDVTWSSIPVQSVNNQIGVIMLTASDVGALPSDTAIPSNAADVGALPSDTFIPSVASDVGAIPAPASASSDNVLAYNGSAWVADKRTVILSYGHSTWAEFLSAYNANAVIYCRASSNSNPATGSQTRMAFMAYVSNADNPTNVEFQYYRSVNTHSATQQGDQMYVYKLDKTAGWTVTVRESYTKIVAGTGLSSSYASSTLTLTNAAAVPSDGTAGQVLTKTNSGYDWEDPTGGGDIFLVSVTLNGSTYEADKTYAEISSAYNGGERIYLTYSYNGEDRLFNLAEKTSSSFLFSYIYTNSLSTPARNNLHNMIFTFTSSGLTLTNLPTYSVPQGGSINQVLTKNGNTDGAITWQSIRQVPSGGATGQVVKKTSLGYDWGTVGCLPNIWFKVNIDGGTQQWTFDSMHTYEVYTDIREIIEAFNSGCFICLTDDYDFGTLISENFSANFYWLSKVWVTEHEDEYSSWQNGHLLFEKVDETSGVLKTFELVSQIDLYEGLDSNSVSVTYSEHSIGGSGDILICEITRVGYDYTSSMTKVEIETAINLGKKVILAFNYDPMYYPYYIGSYFYIDNTTYLPKASVSYVTDGDELIVAFVEIDDYDVVFVHRHGKTITWDWDEQGQ